MPGTITGWPITLKQFLALPEAKPALEMGPCGEIKQKVSPTQKHGGLQLELGARLQMYARRRRLGFASTELRVILGDQTKVPDVAFYRQARVPRTSDGELIDHPTTPPDLVAEIYSPAQEARRELRARAQWYVEQGVELVLLVDPERLTVTAVSPAGQQLFKGDQPLPLGGILPGLELTPNDLFAALQP
jgi:Uma2 family endonuclease